MISFASGAMLYAVIGCVLVYGMARLTRRRIGVWGLCFSFITITFVMLTHHPFPDPDTLVCPVPTATPQLAPLRIIPAMERLYQDGAPWVAWLKSRTIAATVMNFWFCFAIGCTLPAVLRTPARAAGFGALLTALVEISQLTGIAGIYPCAYRQFNVDDLLMNFAGVCAGAWVLRRMLARRAGTTTVPK